MSNRMERNWYIVCLIVIAAALVFAIFMLGYTIAQSDHCRSLGGAIIDGRCVKVVELP